MKSSTFLLFSVLVLASCLKEDAVDLAKPETFTRYYSDGYNNEAVTIEETKDGGFIILANSTYQNTDADPAIRNIMVMKTDAYGNLIWREYYPKEINGAVESGYIANSLTFLPDSSGYLIVGQKIQANASTQAIESNLLVMTINDSNGSVLLNNLSAPPTMTRTINWNGRGGISKDDGNFLIIATDVVYDSTVVIELLPDLSTKWVIQHYQGANSLVNKTFYEPGATPFVYWAGSGIISGASSDLLFTKSKLNSSLTENGYLGIGSVSNDEIATDFCRYGSRFAFTGSSSENGGDIIVYMTSDNGSGVKSYTFTDEIFTKPQPAGTNTQLETGNSISTTNDGGLIILGTFETYAGGLLGRGDTDLILLKINGLGQKQWSTTFGSLDADGGNAIRQTSDGGYAVLATTRLGGLRTVLFIKTDRNGNVN